MNAIGPYDAYVDDRLVLVVAVHTLHPIDYDCSFSSANTVYLTIGQDGSSHWVPAKHVTFRTMRMLQAEHNAMPTVPQGTQEQTRNAEEG